MSTTLSPSQLLPSPATSSASTAGPTSSTPKPTASPPPKQLVDPRRSRYSNIYDPSLIGVVHHVFLAGLGSIGAPLARTLAQAGATSFSGADPDIVAPENLGPQGWEEAFASPCEDGYPHLKTGMLSLQCSRLRENISLSLSAVRAETLDLAKYDILCLCLDSLEARAAIFNKWYWDRFIAAKGAKVQGLVIDGRMAALDYSVISILDPTPDTYLPTLPPPDRASDAPCNEKATCFCAMECAGRMHLSIVRHLMGIPPIPYQGGDLRTGLVVTGVDLPSHKKE